MPRGRALRTLNVNPDAMQKSVDVKTSNPAFSSTENVAGNQSMLEKSFKNAQLLKENKLVKQLEQEVLVMEQQAASTSKLDPSKNSESDNIGMTEEPADYDNFPPSGVFSSSSDVCELSHTTATVEKSSNISESLTSSSNIVADLHEKLCSSHKQNKKRANKRSENSDTADSLPLLNTIVNDILSFGDFPLPSTSSAGTCNTRLKITGSSSAGKKRGKRNSMKTASKRNKKQKKVNEDLALASSIPSTLDDNTSSNTPVLSDSDSDCEITGYVPSNSQQINVSDVDCRNSTESGISDQCIFEIDDTPEPAASEQTSQDASSCTNVRLTSLINRLNSTIQRGDDDDILVIDYNMPQTGSEETGGTNLSRSVIEIGSVNAGGQLTPPVIVVSDDEVEPSVQPALNLRTAFKLSSQQDAASNGRLWQCPICWEELTSMRGVHSTMCGHVFCNPCITHVLKTTRKCPMCRKSLNKKKVHPLFLDGE